jgi:heme a synthase
MVTVGGVTRLTKSGLAMTDWKLQGSLPPMNQQEWQAEFARYKQFPEYQQRKSMTLDEFKFIFWWEYGHRMLGRTLGVIYGVPLLYFTARRMIPAHITGKVALLLGLGGTQGLVGWWMVRSGLNLSPQQQKEIRVSPYRLATHLGMAFTTFALLVHTGLEALHGPAVAQQVIVGSLVLYH